ncbi:hypothetical protein FACS1894151_02270 [Spirochaetia bacterium]|nr:hypothetical protein FACS1894151_02270 [Spirochaetia bacterium]
MICTFRTENKEVFKEAFTKVLVMAQEIGHLKKVGGISVDGTKIKANASKHKAVSYQRAKKMIGQIEAEVAELMKKAEEADSKPLADGLSIPEEIKIREARLAKLREAKEAIEKSYEAVREHDQAEYEAKIAERAAKEAASGKKTGGKPPSLPPESPPDTRQYNFTDNESSIMKAGNGNNFEQAYNAQAAVDTEGSMLIVGGVLL